MAIPLQPEEQQYLTQMIGGSSKLRLTLLYKVSRDWGSAWTFHTKCDSQGPTITVIYNNKDTVYGGYTSQSWLGAGAEFGAHDEKAFLFQIRYNGKSVNNKFPIKADTQMQLPVVTPPGRYLEEEIQTCRILQER